MSILQSTVTTKESLVSDNEVIILRNLLRAQQLQEGIAIIDKITQTYTESAKITDQSVLDLINAKKAYLQDQVVSALCNTKGFPSSYTKLPHLIAALKDNSQLQS